MPELDDYEALFDEAQTLVEQGDQIRSDRVFYSARSIRGREASREYEGNMTAGRCVDAAAAPPAGGRRALQARRISFSCAHPPTSEIYRRTRAHRGVRGLLEGDVLCFIEISWYRNR